MVNCETRKKILKVVVAIGGLVSLYLLFCLINFSVDSSIVGYHISYKQDYPRDIKIYQGVLYLIATVFSPFISSVKKMPLLGIGILISYLVTMIFYVGYIISVWCFFASLISITIFGIMWLLKRSAVVSIKIATK